MHRPSNVRWVPLFAGTLAAVALGLASIAFAEPGSSGKPHRDRGRDRAPALRNVGHPMPDNLRGSPELSAVVFEPASKAFVQLQFDRGTIMHANVSARTIALLQRQGDHTWRTMTFTIPANVQVSFEGRAVGLDRLRKGEHVRITQSGAPGGTLTIVRVEVVRGDRDVSFPPD